MHPLVKNIQKFKVLSILTSLVFLTFISFSNQLFGQCLSGVFVNEFHYDNAGGDIDEFVEIAVPVTSLINPADYVVTLYNGNGGVVYDGESLSNFAVGITDANYTYYTWKPMSGIQNGPDAIAVSEIVGMSFNTCDFVSYEGTFIATDGPAIGETPIDVGVAESSSTPIGSSLQLIGGVWTGPIPATPGSTNAVLAACGITALAPATFTCAASTAGVDMVQVDVEYTGVDPNAVLSITVNGNPVINGGDDPTSTTNGTISFIASEGDMYVVTFTDLSCSNLNESGTISPTQCISCPSVGDLIITEIMFDPSGIEPEAEWFEVCNTTGTAIEMEGMEIGDSGATDHTIASSVIVPGNGCIVISHTDVTVCGGASSAYQHGSFGLAQSGDDVEIKCSGTTLDIVSYGTGFPGVMGGSSISFNAAAPQTPLDNDNGANWCESTDLCGADDRGTPGVANPVCAIVCGITFLANPDYTCQTSTSGVDAVKVDITYGGVDAGAILSITVNGMSVTNLGDDPQTVNGGVISFPAMEGDAIIVTFTDPLCTGMANLTVDETIPPTQCPDVSLCSSDLYINGVVDGDLPGALPKAVQFCASADIADLSLYGVESTNNGGGIMGIEYTFPPDPLAAGECVWVASEIPSFTAFFGFAPCYVSNAVGINGDDGIMLYCGAVIIDQFGDPNCDPNSSNPDCGAWEYADGWAFANDNIANPVFDEAEWMFQQGGLNNAMTNAGAPRPYPLPGTMCPDLLYPTVSPCPDDYAGGGMANSLPPLTGLQDATVDYEADGDIISDQIIGSVNPTIMVDYDSGTSVLMNPGFEVYLDVTYHAFIDGCGGL